MATGYSQSEVIDRHFQDLFLLPEERESVMQVFNRLSSGEYPNQNRNAWLMRNGDVRQIEWSNTILTGPDNEVLYLIGMGLDVTDDHIRNQALRESEDRFSRIFRSNPLGMAILNDPDGTILDINESFLRLIGAKSGEVVGKQISALGLLPPEDLLTEEMLNNLRQSPIINLERKVLTRSKILLHLVFSFDMIEFVGDPCILLMVQDLTERITGRTTRSPFFCRIGTQCARTNSSTPGNQSRTSVRSQLPQSDRILIPAVNPDHLGNT